MDSPHKQRAIILLQQARFPQARQELFQTLAAEPEDAHAHALLALVQSALEEHAEAGREARKAIELAPDQPFNHYAFAQVQFARNRFDEVVDAIREAIRLDPDDADYRGVLANVLGAQEKWAESLTAAEEGLALDAEHSACTNARARALTHLGRRAEAEGVIAAALQRDPDDAATHANQGWTLLHQGDHRRAAEHFRAALRLDPDSDWARRGIIEALKARNVLYRGMLTYFLWMARLSGPLRWLVVLAPLIGGRIISFIEGAIPALKPYLWPVGLALIAVVYLTWVAQPLSNLFLRLNHDGNLALSREERHSANLVGVCLAAAIGLAIYAWLGDDARGWIGAACCAAYVIPVAGIFSCDVGWPRQAMTVYAVGVAAAGAWLAVTLITATTAGAISNPLSLFALGVVGATWVGALLSRQTPTK